MPRTFRTNGFELRLFVNQDTGPRGTPLADLLEDIKAAPPDGGSCALGPSQSVPHEPPAAVPFAEGSFVAGASGPASAQAPFRPIRERIRTRLLDAAEGAGNDRATAARTLAELESERPLLDWLLNGGFEKLLALLLELLKFAA